MRNKTNETNELVKAIQVFMSGKVSPGYRPGAIGFSFSEEGLGDYHSVLFGTTVVALLDWAGVLEEAKMKSLVAKILKGKSASYGLAHHAFYRDGRGSVRGLFAFALWSLELGEMQNFVENLLIGVWTKRRQEIASNFSMGNFLMRELNIGSEEVMAMFEKYIWQDMYDSLSNIVPGPAVNLRTIAKNGENWSNSFRYRQYLELVGE